MSINKPKYDEIFMGIRGAIYGNLCSKKIRIHDNFSLTRNEVRHRREKQ